jgi:alkyl hydroperoxide reductase subunit F
MYDLIVVGGGPAGLTAAIYGIRKRLNVLMITKDLGGKTQYRLALPWIQEYQVIRGLEIVNKFRSELEYLKFARHMDLVEKINKKDDHFVIATKGGEEFQTRAIIIATGARQVRLNVPGEKEFTMRGLCYSALSYAPLFIDKDVVVIGEGDLALRSTAELATVARHVHLVCKGDDNSLATPLGKKLDVSKNVKILKDYQVVEFKGDEFAEAVALKDLSGNPVEIKADGFFIEKALTPMSQMVADLVELDKHGRIIIDCGSRTNIPGIFAAGDVTNTYAEQVLVAVGEGAKAALSAYEFLLHTL